MRARDYARAAEVWTLLADRGDRDARYQLGSLYRTGRGVPRDPARAFRLWLAAAEAGDVRAQFGVAGLYAGGWGVAADREQALRWYRAAAAQGNEAARERGVDHARRRERVGTAAQDDGIAGFEAERTGVGGDVGPALIDDADDAERRAHPLQMQPVGAIPGRRDGADGIGQVGDLLDAARHRLDPRRGQRGAVQE